MINHKDFFAIAVNLKLPIKGSDIEKLLFHCHTYKNIFNLKYSAIENILQRKLRFKKNNKSDLLKKTEILSNICSLKKIKIIHIHDFNYPRYLREIYDYPFMLYFLGKEPDQGETMLSIVGTRNPTMQGYQLTKNLSAACSDFKITTISGMAQGIDSAVHWGSVDAQGKTIAVMGCGIDICYPKKNRNLYEKILENNGTILSEYHPGFLPQKWTFPCRNRIIAGLSRSLLITEAPAKSGAMITAQCALENNRDIYVQKYRNYPLQRQGNLALIEQGAREINSANDLLQNLLSDHRLHVMIDKKTQQKKIISLDELIIQNKEKAEIIVNILTEGSQNTDNLLSLSGFTQNQLTGILLKLEKNGIIKRNYGNSYSLIH